MAEEDLNGDDISETRYNLRLPAARAERENAGGGTIATLSAYFQQRCVRGRANRRLFTAVDTGYLVGLRAALRRGADINVTDFGWTPLNWAVHLMTLERGKGCPDVIIELLAAGADPNAGHKDGSGLRIAAYGGRKDVVLMLLRAGAQVSDAFRQRPSSIAFWASSEVAWRGIAPDFFRTHYPALGNVYGRTYLHNVARAGGFGTYKDVRYRECVAAHLVARERRLPAEILDVTLNFLLDRGSIHLVIQKKNTLSHISNEKTVFRTRRWTLLARIFEAYETKYGLVRAGIKMCYRLPGSDVWLDHKGTVREAGLDLAEKSDDFARSFAPRILIEAHDASGVVS